MNLIRLTQLQDFRLTVNDITDGKIHVGLNIREPKVGEKYFIADISDKYHRRGFVTEVVEEIIDDSTFKTKNYIYLHEKIEKDENS